MSSNGDTHFSGNGWYARIPTALLVAVLSALLGGGFEVLRRLDRIEAKVEHSREMQARSEKETDRRLSALERPTR